MLHLVVLSGWKPGMRKVALTKLIREMGRMDLAKAKRCTDEVLAGRPVTLTFLTADEADLFCSDASPLGVLTRREDR